MRCSAALVAVLAISLARIHCLHAFFFNDDGLVGNIFDIQDRIIASGTEKNLNRNKPTVIRTEQRKPNGWKRQEIVYNLKTVSPEEEDNFGKDFDSKFDSYFDVDTDEQRNFDSAWENFNDEPEKEKKTKTESQKAPTQSQAAKKLPKKFVESKKSTAGKKSKSTSGTKPESVAKLTNIEADEDDDKVEFGTQPERRESEKTKNTVFNTADRYQKIAERHRTPRPAVSRTEIPFVRDKEITSHDRHADIVILRLVEAANDDDDDDEEDEPADIYAISVDGDQQPHIFALEQRSGDVHYLGRFYIGGLVSEAPRRGGSSYARRE